MGRPRRRSRVGWVGVVAAVGFLVIAPWAWAAPELPTVVFSATATAPGTCGSRPNLTTLTVRTGSTFMIANMTGVTATVDVGRRRLIELPPGTGAVVRMSLGPHDLQLIPDCAAMSEAVVAVVNVVTPGEMTGRATSAATADPDESAVGISLSSMAASNPQRSTTTAPTAQNPGAAAASEPGGGEDESLGAKVVRVETLPFRPGDNPKSVRLLAAIATICALGVTAAIIRAIVTQRTTDSVR
jgi:hypothetical protein